MVSGYLSGLVLTQMLKSVVKSRWKNAGDVLDYRLQRREGIGIFL